MKPGLQITVLERLLANRRVHAAAGGLYAIRLAAARNGPAERHDDSSVIGQALKGGGHFDVAEALVRDPRVMDDLAPHVGTGRLARGSDRVDAAAAAAAAWRRRRAAVLARGALARVRR